ncbi:hypothetical protein AXW67_12535 [Bradyrhizobium neotropicale]|uniref:Uncharacterized protein n=1 Tax=Bradyrhizobium neotropicale TaxID=1497615 RepID=A0A176Z6S1_9BRAD|nr:hypothetical protein AXW67_12535 [Bradyrhizobium neotropicale]
MDEEFCRERLRTVRELAETADPLIKKRLMDLARHYERRIAIGAREREAPGSEPRGSQGQLLVSTSKPRP